MELHTLLGGRSKKKMVILETNSKAKCEKYMKNLKVTPRCKYKWFEIRKALPDAPLKVHKSSNKWTNYNASGPQRIKKK